MTIITESRTDQIEIKKNLTKILVDLGLSQNEAAIYLFLVKHGPHTATIISLKAYADRKLHRTECYRVLDILGAKGVVRCRFTKPYSFEALHFEEAFDLLVNNFRVKASLLGANREVALHLLDEYMRTSVVVPERMVSCFMKLNGDYTYNVAARALDNARESVKLFVDDYIFLKLYFSGFIDSIKQRSNLNQLLMCGDSDKCLSFAHEYSGCFLKVSCGFPSFVVLDNREVIVFGDGGVWSNEPSFVQTYSLLANQLKEKGVLVK